MKKACIISTLAFIAIFHSCTSNEKHDKERIAKEATIKKLRNDDGCNTGCHGNVGVTDITFSGKQLLVVQRKRDSFTVGEKIFIDSATLEGSFAYYADTNDWSPFHPWYRLMENDSLVQPHRDTALVKTIRHGGSLCGTLGVTLAEAKRIVKDSKDFHFHSYWQKGKYIVIVHAGDTFERRNGVWLYVSPLKRGKGGYNDGYGNY